METKKTLIDDDDENDEENERKKEAKTEKTHKRTQRTKPNGECIRRCMMYVLHVLYTEVRTSSKYELKINSNGVIEF